MVRAVTKILTAVCCRSEVVDSNTHKVQVISKLGFKLTGLTGLTLTGLRVDSGSDSGSRRLVQASALLAD